MNEKGIRFRNGKYYFRVTVTDETGKRRQVERYGGKTEKECIKNKMRFEMEYENKFIKINSKMLLFDVFDLFFESYKKNWNKNTLRNSTIHQVVHQPLGRVILNLRSYKVLPIHALSS